jgi:hypothetical protein
MCPSARVIILKVMNWFWCKFDTEVCTESCRANFIFVRVVQLQPLLNMKPKSSFVNFLENSLPYKILAHEKHIDLQRLFETALVGSEWSASRPVPFTPSERSPRYLLDRRLGGPQSRSGCKSLPRGWNRTPAA